MSTAGVAVLWGCVSVGMAFVFHRTRIGRAVALCVAIWVAACGYLAATGSWGKAAFMLAWGAGVISSADNIVRPLVLSGRVKMNTLFIFFSLVGGAQAFGIIGLFLGPMVVSVAMALLRMLEEERTEWESSEPPQPATLPQ